MIEALRWHSLEPTQADARFIIFHSIVNGLVAVKLTIMFNARLIPQVVIQ